MVDFGEVKRCCSRKNSYEGSTKIAEEGLIESVLRACYAVMKLKKR